MKHLITLLTLLAPVSLTSAPSPDPLVSRISVFTIHVSDVAVHNQVFHFLTDVLRLPVDYGPEMAGERRYAAVYAGNMFLEPCGPFSNMRYPTNVFQALFYGVNCSSDQAPSGIARTLQERKIGYEQPGPGTFHIQDAVIGENIYLAISSARLSDADRAREDSMRSVMIANNRDGLGLEYVKEVWLAYTDATNLQAWKKFIQPSELVNDELWKLNGNQSIRFIKAEVKGVKGIVFKIRSIEQTRRWLVERGLFGGADGHGLELDRTRTYGLLIYLTEK